MKKTRNRLLALALALILVCMAGCGGNNNATSSGGNSNSTPTATPDPAPSAGSGEQVLKVATTLGSGGSSDATGDKTKYPWHNPDGVTTAAMYRTLLLADANLTDVSPSLATEYTVSEDGLTYTFTMKEGVKWSDGEPLTAEDVAFSIKTNLKVASGNAIFTNAFTNIVGADAWRDGSASDLEGVKVDGNVVTITLSSSYGAFIPVIAQFCILPEHAMKDLDPLELHNSEYWANPVTSGAFKLGELSVGNYYTLVPNEHYEGTPWKITQIINYYVPDLLVAAQAGNTYMLNTNAPEIISELGKLDFMTMYPVDILFYRYFICNMKGVDGNENPVMQDKRVREAILYAIDRETIAEQLYPGLAHVLHSGVPNDYAEYNGTAYEYNPEKAKQLLQEANYDFNHTFRILYYYSDQNSIDFMDTIAYYLREVGMKVETVHSQQGTVDLFQTRNYDVGYKGLSAFNIAEWYGEYSSGNANFPRRIWGRRSTTRRRRPSLPNPTPPSAAPSSRSSRPWSRITFTSCPCTPSATTSSSTPTA